jgi:hypothetical protein
VDTLPSSEYSPSASRSEMVKTLGGEPQGGDMDTSTSDGECSPSVSRSAMVPTLGEEPQGGDMDTSTPTGSAVTDTSSVKLRGEERDAQPSGMWSPGITTSARLRGDGLEERRESSVS